MLNFLRTGQVQHNFDCTVITTNDFRFYILVCYNLDLIEKNVNHLQAMFLVYFRNMFLEKYE